VKSSAAVAFAAALAAVVLYFVGGALRYDPVARAFPVLVGIPVLILLVLQALMESFPATFSSLRKLDTRELIQVDEALIAQAKAARAEGPRRGSEFVYYAWAGAFVAAIYLIGFYAAIAAFLLGLLRVQLGERLPLSLAITAIMLVIAYYGFAVVMEVPLFTGVVLDWAGLD
jgi:hypothetical protein